jgi:helicase
MLVLDLSLPDVLKSFIAEKRNVKSLYPPQEEAVRSGIFNGENIIMVTSTASGKTLLAEIAAVSNVLMNDKKTIVTVPLKALAYEKLMDFKIYEELGVRITASTGEYDSDDKWLESFDIIITTYEKLDSILRHKPSWLGDVGQLIVDELHYVGDSERGPIIESIISKMRMLGLTPQIIGLSATIGNAEELAAWLGAKLVKTSWRPIPLKEGVYLRPIILFSDGSKTKVHDVGEPVTSLVLDSLQSGGQALVFSSSRSSAVKIAKQLSRLICDSPSKLIDVDAASRVAEDIKKASSSKLLGDELAQLIRCGASFHHAGLELEVRRLIEEAFRERVIKVLASTTTLAAGVNLPARRVIISDYRRYEVGEGMLDIPVMEYKQMAGRAGRPGLDPYGEAILIASTEREAHRLLDLYINAEPEHVVSRFFVEENMAFNLLSIIASGYADDMDGIFQFLSNTLAYAQYKISSNVIQRNVLVRRVNDMLKFLVESGFIEERNGEFSATPLGLAVNRTYLDPYTANDYIRGLSQLSGKATYLGILFLAVKSRKVPKLRVRKSEEDKWADELMSRWSKLPLMPPTIPDYDEEELHPLMEELKTALMIMDWINEIDEDTLLKQYDAQPGDLRMYIDQLDWLLGAMVELSKVLKLRELSGKIDILRYRVKYGIKADALELALNLEGIGRARARELYKAGFKSIEDIATASPARLQEVRGIGSTLARSLVEQAKKLLETGKITRVPRDEEPSGDISDYLGN